MNAKIQHKIDEYRRIAASSKGKVPSTLSDTKREDSLNTVIRYKKEADQFMAELQGVIDRLR